MTSVSIQLDDATLQKFGMTTPNLEQLDLLGVRGYTKIGVSCNSFMITVHDSTILVACMICGDW